MPTENAIPRFIQTGRIAAASISVANANRDGTGTVVTVFSAGAQGSLVELVRVIALGTTTAGVVRIYVHDGSNYHLLDEIAVSAVTPTGSTPVFEGEYVPSKPLILPTGWSIRAAPLNGESFKVLVTGGDY